MTIVSTTEFAQTYNDFLSISAEFKKFALEKAEFKETVDSAGEKIERRPIVLVNNGNARRAVENRLQKWSEHRDALHHISPERFPLSSALFNPAPTIIREVKQAQIYINRASSVCAHNPATHVKRLIRTRDAYLKKPESGLHEDKVAEINKEIEFFEANIDKKFRKRRDNYTEVVIAVTHTNGEEIKYKVHDGGIFLYAHGNESPVSLLTPDQAQTKQKRVSIYDSIEPVPTCLPICGKLYLMNDIVAAENEAARNEHRASYKKK